jgi:hypothetical protein
MDELIERQEASLSNTSRHPACCDWLTPYERSTLAPNSYAHPRFYYENWYRDAAPPEHTKWFF